jgi:RNA polymerase sigma-70 factor, ECF subfamily
VTQSHSEVGVRQRSVNDMDTTPFESERARLTRLAARILGSSKDADDVVQEAWLRFARTDAIDEPSAWLTTVVTRLCLDTLRRNHTRAAFETEVAPIDSPGPEVDAMTADQVGEAMQVVLDTLAPAERAAFVLHEVFGYPFAEIGTMLGRSDDAVRQLASRARRKVRGIPPSAHERRAEAESARVVQAFISAAHGGELSQLLTLLAPDVIMHSDAAGQRMRTEALYVGPDAVAARFNGSRGARVVMVDGDLGAAWMVNGTPRVVFLFHVIDALVESIELIADAEVVAMMDVTLVKEGAQ